MSDSKERVLYCGNLSEKVTEDLLYELFLQAGPVESVKIPTEKSGYNKNYAFITFKDEASVPYAVALMQGMSLFGKPVMLDYRTGAESTPNKYLDTVMVHQRTQSCPSDYYLDGTPTNGAREYHLKHLNNRLDFQNRNRFLEHGRMSDRMYSDGITPSPLRYDRYENGYRTAPNFNLELNRPSYGRMPESQRRDYNRMSPYTPLSHTHSHQSGAKDRRETSRREKRNPY